MSAETEYLRAERDSILQVLRLIDALLQKEERSQYETIALGKLLQDVYSGLERIQRALLEGKGVRTEKTASWHKDLLWAARRSVPLSEEEFAAFSRLLLFRHVEVHGYGFTLEDQRLVEIAQATMSICRGLLSRPALSA
jgi:hypothetical protein